MKVECEISAITLENDDGYDVDSVCATCTQCGHETESFGTSDASIKRCLVLIRKECPEGQSNFYVADEDCDVS